MLQKKILLYAMLCGLVFLIGYTIHHFILVFLEVDPPFTLWQIYLFQCVATFALVTVFEVISRKSKSYRDQLGFLYLAAMAVKVGLFSIFFSNILFSSLVLSRADSLSLLIPIFLYLFLEVMIIVKILNRNI